jgi:membrane-bound serine protease (ClpP class)
MVVEAQRRQATTGAEGLLGRSGVAVTPLQPEGWVLVQGERWRAQADGPLDLGARVEVVGIDGLRLRVRKGA